MHRISLLVLLIGVLASIASAASATTFCKCTCFKNSTIIALGPQHTDANTPPSLRSLPNVHPESKRAASTSCSQCTKAFCLSRGIDFCQEAKDEDVQTMCFQRDSNKDRIIVWGFILGTSGLLGWAAFKRVVELREGKRAGVGGLPAAVGSSGIGRGAYSPLDPTRPSAS